MENRALKWQFVQFFVLSDERIPKSAGVYAIIKTVRVHGLPTNTEVIYIGKSKDLRRRFREHKDIWREHNRKLRDRFEEENLEFWYAPVPASKIDDLEASLIREVGPTDNERLKED